MTGQKEKETYLRLLMDERDRMAPEEAQFVKRMSLKEEDCSPEELERLRLLTMDYPEASQ